MKDLESFKYIVLELFKKTLYKGIQGQTFHTAVNLGNLMFKPLDIS